MQIDVRKGSKNEVFCCSVKKAKNIFKNTNIYLNFAYLGKTYVIYRREKAYNFVTKNIKGKVVCSLNIFSRQENAILSFYLIKEESCSKNITDEFEINILPAIYDFYIKVLNESLIVLTDYCLIVELIDEKLKLHISKI